MNELYYIALLPDDKLSQLCLEYKLMAKDLFQSEASLRSPAHITLISPFSTNELTLAQIKLILAQIVTQYHAMKLQLNGWQHFGVRTIYLGCKPNLALGTLQTECYQQINALTKLRQEAEFTPHISIVNRDLAEIKFNSAWNYFTNQNFPALTKCTQLVLFKHSAQGWNIHQCLNLVPEVASNA